MIKEFLEWVKNKYFAKKSMSVFDEIQNEITGTTELSVILRRANILAFNLKNQEFKDWVNNELNGYQQTSLLPDYRKLGVIAMGDFGNGVWSAAGQLIPMTLIPKEYRSFFNEYEMFQSIKSLESTLKALESSGKGMMQITIPPELYSYLHYKLYNNLQCVSAWRVLPEQQIEQVVENARNGLLNFILELADKYPQIKSNSFSSGTIPNEHIKKVFNYYILGGSHTIIGSSDSTNVGDNMSIFDQREQKVKTQYNAAGNINFNDAQNPVDFAAELQKLKTEFSRLANEEAIDGEIVTDAEYQMTKAIQQSQKEEPNKKTILDHLNTAKSLVEGIVATAGIIEGLNKAAEVAHTIFK